MFAGHADRGKTFAVAFKLQTTSPFIQLTDKMAPHPCYETRTFHTHTFTRSFHNDDGRTGLGLSKPD